MINEKKNIYTHVAIIFYFLSDIMVHFILNITIIYELNFFDTKSFSNSKYMIVNLAYKIINFFSFSLYTIKLPRYEKNFCKN